jgi:hypothetical protein
MSALVPKVKVTAPPKKKHEIINEYIKSTVNQFINVYEKLFNVIFDNGIMPSSWLIGMIKPIYKNKGDKFDPKNYRPITIVSCLGKLFTAILNETHLKISSFVIGKLIWLLICSKVPSSISSSPS